MMQVQMVRKCLQALCALSVVLLVAPKATAHHEAQQGGLPLPLFPTNSLVGPILQFTENDGQSTDGGHKLNISSFLRLPVATDVSRIVRPGMPLESLMVYLEPHPGTYIFATNSCGAVGDTNNSYAVRVLRGSLYSVEGERKIHLARGRMLIASEKSVIEVHAGAARATLAPGAVAVVETTANGLTRVYCLTQSQREGAAVMISFAGKPSAKECVGLMFGQEAVIADHELSDKELIPTDGIERQAPQRTVASAAPGNVRLFEYSLAQMAFYDELINCPQMHASSSTKLARRLNNMYEDVLAYAALQNGFSAGDSKMMVTSPAKATDGVARAAFTGSNAAESAQYFKLVAEKGRLIAVRKDSVYKIVEPGAVRVENGSFLVTSKRPFKLYVQDKQVIVSKGAVGLVQAGHTGFKVINLGDVRKNSLQVVSDKHVIDLLSGQEVVCTDAPPALSDVFDIHTLGHRGTSSRNVPQFGWVTISDISIKDVLTYHPLVAAMRVTGKHPAEKDVVAHMVKTAAIINMVCPRAGLFQQGQPEDETGSSMRIAARCNNCLR